MKTPSILESPVPNHKMATYETPVDLEHSDRKTDNKKKGQSIRQKVDSKVLDTPLRPFMPSNPFPKVKKNNKIEVSSQKNLE